MKKLMALSIASLFASSLAFGATHSEPCGLNGDISQRIESCNEVIDNFALVTRTIEGKEVYKDFKSGLLWSDRLDSKKTQKHASLDCKSDLSAETGISGRSWRLPSLKDYKKADKHGITEALPNMEEYLFWTSEPAWNDFNAYVFNGNDGYLRDFQRTRDFSVRCVSGNQLEEL